MADELVNVRYMVDDVENAVEFYTTHFASRCAPTPRLRSPRSCSATYVPNAFARLELAVEQ